MNPIDRLRELALAVDTAHAAYSASCTEPENPEAERLASDAEDQAILDYQRAATRKVFLQLLAIAAGALKLRGNGVWGGAYFNHEELAAAIESFTSSALGEK